MSFGTNFDRNNSDLGRLGGKLGEAGSGRRNLGMGFVMPGFFEAS
jgi:hypothetical protein